MRFLEQYRELAFGVMRISVAFLYLSYGLDKAFGLFGREPPPIVSLLGAAGVIETVFGLLIVLGLLTRPAAFVASGQMAAAYFIGHFPQGFWPHHNGGVPAVTFCFVFLFIATRGGGRLSLDHMLGWDLEYAE